MNVCIVQDVNPGAKLDQAMEQHRIPADMELSTRPSKHRRGSHSRNSEDETAHSRSHSEHHHDEPQHGKRHKHHHAGQLAETRPHSQGGDEPGQGTPRHSHTAEARGDEASSSGSEDVDDGAGSPASSHRQVDGAGDAHDTKKGATGELDLEDPYKDMDIVYRKVQHSHCMPGHALSLACRNAYIMTQSQVRCGTQLAVLHGIGLSWRDLWQCSAAYVCIFTLLCSSCLFHTAPAHRLVHVSARPRCLGKAPFQKVLLVHQDLCASGGIPTHCAN